MSISMLIIWVALMLVGFAGSAMFSGMETGAYSLNRIRLHVLSHHGNRHAQILEHLLAHPTTLLTTLLIGNNVANYLGTAAMGVILESKHMNDVETMLLNALFVMPILFVVGETLPKDLFAAYSDKLMYPLAPVLRYSRTLFTYTGLVPLIAMFGRTLMRAIGHDPRAAAYHPRRQVGVLVREGVGYGLLSYEQSAIVDRVLKLAERAVRDEMTAWAGVVRLHDHDDADALRRLAERSGHSHVPVVDKGGTVIGILRLNDALVYAKEHCPPINELIRPAHTVPHDMPVREALSQLKRHTTGLAIVTGKTGQPVGIVTIKDLIEPITGDLRQW